MAEVLSNPVFGISVTVAAYAVGVWINKKLKTPLANPMLIATALLIAFFLLTGIPVEPFNEGGEIINFLIFPATASIGLSIYANYEVLKKNLVPVLGGCLAGAATAVFSVLGLCKLFGLDEKMTASLLPKSVTTAIAVPICEQNGGIAQITIVALMIAGMLGAVLAPSLCRWFHIEDNEVATGLAIGCSSHAAGTSTAVKMGQTIGAMSGLAIGVCGFFTVILSLFFPYLL